MAAIAAHWSRFGQAIARAIALEAANHSAQAQIPADIARDALWFRTIAALETIRALQDTSGHGLFPLLTEIPLKGLRDTLCWNNLIAMRNLMIHQWWAIDEAIVEQTVREDFPVLDEIAASVGILPGSYDGPSSARATAMDVLPQPAASIIYLDRATGLRRIDLQSQDRIPTTPGTPRRARRS